MRELKGPRGEDFFRHLVLNMIRGHNVRFRAKYGEMVICCDSRSYWRKKAFPYYKATRPKKGERDEIFESVYEWMNAIKSDLDEYFPYRVLEVEECEGDDIIGFLTEKFHAHEPIVIVSEDKDFRQLQRYPNVVQYAPVKSKMIVENKPIEYLREHIIRGDGGDAIVNIFSDLDTFVNSEKRQKPVSKKKMEQWVKMSPSQFCEAEDISEKRFKFQELMVDLSKIPEYIKQRISDAFDNANYGDKSKVLGYMMKHKMRHMTDHFSDF
jgi:hypothetical protein